MHSYVKIHLYVLHIHYSLMFPLAVIHIIVRGVHTDSIKVNLIGFDY